jgi:hypothetical protein
MFIICKEWFILFFCLIAINKDSKHYNSFMETIYYV